MFSHPCACNCAPRSAQVATGGIARESMPMLLQVPGFFGPPYRTSILGFGDIVLPGLLLAFLRIWDCALRKSLAASYFPPMLAGFGTGLCLTYLALLFNVGGNQVINLRHILQLWPCFSMWAAIR